MHLLKSDLPPTVLVYLSEMSHRSMSPAWLMIDPDGTLAQCGGALAHYGLAGLRTGQPAAEQVSFLTGQTPAGGVPVELPRVLLQEGVFADIHIFTGFGFTWTLLTDTTASALEAGQYQQRSNELLLKQYAAEAEMVRRSEQYFRSLVEHSSDVIVVFDAAGAIKYASQSLARVLGYAIGKNQQMDFGIIHRDDLARVQASYRAVIASGGPPVTISFRIRHADGSWRHVDATGSNLLDNPEINGLVITFHDFSKRKAAEDEQARLQASLQRSEKMAAMGALVAGVAHEVRNPLFSISATLDAFEARLGAGGEDYRQYTDVLRGEVDRLSRLMADLLEYGKPPELNPGRVSPHAIIADAIQACRDRTQPAQVEVINQTPAELTVHADYQRMVQVFQNLIANAIQHSPAQGQVSITAETKIENRQTWLSFHVIDQGSGFRAEDMNSIFEPFFSRRRGGTGLGLSIVQRIVEAHEGTVTAANDPGGGACVTVRLPHHS
ncbi:MAG: two-component system sensor histidine kinase NtrB [Blastocatellia bacterium]